MKIELRNLTVRDIFEGYQNDEEEGVVGYHGKLNIRPKYQREFVYKLDQQRAVIDTISKGLPLNVMYWCKTEDGTYELMDGQQRTLSFCSYCNGEFSVDEVYFHNLPKDKKEAILNYKLFIYVCEGSDSEKLDWFRIINIAGEKLTDQELRNAVYAGPWTTSAKKYFSKTGCVASKLSEKYIPATPIRQELLEKALKWICDKEKCTIEDYMGRHQNDPDASELWSYFRNIIDWVDAKFIKYRGKWMKKVHWGLLYNQYGQDTSLDAQKLEARIEALMADHEVTNKAGIYDYVLSGNESKLSLRTFDDEIKEEVYAKQKGICPKCGKHFKIEEMQADHITPWSKGGKTTAENCQMLCADCNRKKSNT